jgi:ribosomal protein S18 acetylase RimI-like enzyme
VPAPIEIRRLSPADAADYREVRLAALEDAPEAFSSRYEIEAARPEEAFAARLQTSVVHAAYRERRIVGMAGVAPRSDSAEPRCAFLWGVYVRPETRGLGVASRILHAAIATALEHYDEITLDVVVGNHAALALYEKFGFARRGKPRPMQTGVGYRDEISMVKCLRGGHATE